MHFLARFPMFCALLNVFIISFFTRVRDGFISDLVSKWGVCFGVRELYLYSPLKKAADVYANQNGDRPPHSRQTNSLENILLLQYSVHLRVIIIRSSIGLIQ